MTKYEIIDDMFEGLKMDSWTINRLSRLPKSTLEQYYEEYLRVKDNPSCLKDGDVKAWQINTRWWLTK